MKANLAQALRLLPAAPTAQYPQGSPFATLMAGGSMLLEVFAPARSGLGADLQQPHTQDELYFIQGGTAQLAINGQRFDCVAGDVLHVAAGVAHRFENFSDDFVTWVVFYGPQGGE